VPWRGDKCACCITSGQEGREGERERERERERENERERKRKRERAVEEARLFDICAFLAFAQGKTPKQATWRTRATSLHRRAVSRSRPPRRPP